MLSEDANHVLTMFESELIKDPMDANLSLMILEYVAERWGAERGDGVLKEIFQHLIDSGRATYDQLYRSSVILNQPCPITPKTAIYQKSLLEFDASFKDLVIDHDRDDSIGVVLYSAIRFGMLLDVDLIRSFYKQNWKSSIIRHKDDFWFSLSKPRLKTEFIWSTDDLTLLLINTMDSTANYSKDATWYSHVRRLLSLHGNFSRIPSMHEFMSSMKGLLKGKVPSYLFDVLSNRLGNRGLCQHGHIRKISGLVPPSAIVVDKIKVQRRKSSDDQLKILDLLKNHTDIDCISTCFNKLSLSKSQESVLKCVMYYMKHPTEYGEMLISSGLMTMTSTIFDRFSELFANDDPELLSNKSLIYIFSTHMSLLKPAASERARTAFNYYMWYLHNTQDRGLVELDTSNKAISEQRPLILMPLEYEWLYYILEQEEKLEASFYRVQLLRATRFALILGYRLGLRGGEVKHVRPMDFDFHGFSVLKIEPYDKNNLKTKRAYRFVGISGRLLRPEFEFLKSYIQDYTSSGRREDERLIEFSSDKKVGTNNYYIFQFLCHSIRVITGDNNTAYHTLRHSFASNNVLMTQALSEDSGSIVKDFFGNEVMMQYEEYLNRVDPPHNGCRTSRPLHQLALEIGHASPKTTLKSYIHTIDYLVPFYQRHMIPQFSTAELAGLLGVSRQAIQKTAEPDPETQLRALSDYRGMLLRQLKRKVPEIQLTGWRSVDEALTGAVSDYGSRRFDSFLQQFRYYKTGKTSARQLLVRYPGLTELPRDFRRDARTGQLLKSTTSKIDKRVIERIMENLLAIPPQKREEAYYRWSLIADAVVSQKSLTQLKNLSERQIAAQAFLMRLSQEVVESTEKE